MSTRSHILIEQEKNQLYPIMIYKHSDGYPSGVLPFLQEFTHKFLKVRGHDPEYFLAQLLRHWSIQDRWYEAIIKTAWGRDDYEEPYEGFNERHKNIQSEYAFLSWGITPLSDIHGDIEYFYIVKTTGKIEVRVPKKGFWENPTLENTKKMTVAEVKKALTDE